MKHRVSCVSVAAVLSVALSACAGGDGVGQRQSADAFGGVDFSAVVNPQAGTVTLPADRFSISVQEAMHLDHAASVLVAVCAQEQGIPFYAVGVGNEEAPEYGMFNEFGPWTEELANKFGYFGPATKADLIANGVIPGDTGLPSTKLPNESLTDTDTDKLKKVCKNPPHREELISLSEYRDYPKPLSDMQLNNLLPQLKKESGFVDAVADLKQCYRESNIETIPASEDNELGLEVKGADSSVIDSQQVDLAVRDAKCKEKVDFIQRIADVVAKLQAPIIKENIDELVAYRKRVDKALKDADDYIAAHPDVIWHNEQE